MITDTPSAPAGSLNQPLQTLRTRLAAARQPVDRQHYKDARGQTYSHPQGWNDALDFVDRAIAELTAEKDAPCSGGAGGGPR